MTILTIRDMTLADCEAVAELDKAAFSQPLSRQGYEREYTNPDSTTLVAAAGDEIIGFANLWNICGEVTLNNIAVREDCRSNGAGTALVQEALRRFSGCDLMTLEVRRSNEGAVRFYERLGFVKVGCRKNFYQLPREDAILMTRFFEER